MGMRRKSSFLVVLCACLNNVCVLLAICSFMCILLLCISSATGVNIFICVSINKPVRKWNDLEFRPRNDAVVKL